MVWRDASTESVGQIRDITVYGAEFIDNDDGTGQLIIGAGDGSGDGTGGGPGGGDGDNGGFVGSPVQMLNNSGGNLSVGSVVIVDDTVDNAVDTTTSAASTYIVGVAQAPILNGEIGPILFNGYAAEVVTTGTVALGDYLETSTVAGSALAVAARTAGTFAVVTAAGTVEPETILEDSATTESVGSVTSLSITMPTALAAQVGRVLFLSLWRDPSVTTAVTLAGWTRLGATSGWWYYYRISTGSDTCAPSWTTDSPAVAVVLLLGTIVDASDPFETQAFEGTAAAATLAGMSSAPRYVFATVHDVAAEPSGWDLLASSSTSVAGSSGDLNATDGTVTSYTNGTGAAASNPTNANDGNTATYSALGAGGVGGAPYPIRGWEADLGASQAVEAFIIKEVPTNKSWLKDVIGATMGVGAYGSRLQYWNGSAWTNIAGSVTSFDGNTPGTWTYTFTSPISAQRWRLESGGKNVTGIWGADTVYTWGIIGDGTLTAKGTIVGKYIGRASGVTSPFPG